MLINKTIMGNESHNKWHIRGPQKDIDEIVRDTGSCGDLKIIRKGPNCVVIYNRLRELSLWNYSVKLLREHKECWICNDFIREFCDVGGLCLDNDVSIVRIYQPSITRTNDDWKKFITNAIHHIIESTQPTVIFQNIPQYNIYREDCDLNSIRHISL
jgi:hypothetical protein